MRNATLLSSILVAVVAWAVPGSVSATPPPLEAPPQGEAAGEAAPAAPAGNVEPTPSPNTDATPERKKTQPPQNLTCEDLMRSVPEPTKKKDKHRNKYVGQSWDYVICIDTTTRSIEPKVVRRTSEDGADPDFVDGGNHLFEGRRVHVYVVHHEGDEVSIDLTGTEGTTNYIYNGTGEGGPSAFAPASKKSTDKWFAGRKADQTAKLSVTVTDKGTKSAIASHNEIYNVTAVYRAAIRFGLVGLVSPFAREYSDRAATDAANNPGKVITVDGGGRSPLFHSELVTAMSVFFTPVYQGEGTVTGGAMFGLGILAAGSEKGFNALTSVHFGLELDVGRDFAIAAVVALRRTDVLKTGYFVGRAVADDEQYTRFGVRPSFGLMLTWSPAFSQAFGKARKG